MAKKDGTIYFYQLQFSRVTTQLNPDGSFVEHALPALTFKEEFIRLLNTNLNQYHTMTFRDEFSLEVIASGNHINLLPTIGSLALNENTTIIFGKLGRKKDIINFQRRNVNTLKPNDIEKSIDEFFECFTYFYTFYEENNGNPVVTIAFLKAQAAPDIRKLALLSSLMTSPDYKIKVEPIITPNGLALLMNKRIINSINYSVSLPTDDTLAQNIFGVNHEDDFDSFNNLKTLNFTITLKGSKGKNILNNRNILANISERVRTFTNNRNGTNASISAMARNDNEKMIEYDFLDNLFISKTSFDFGTESGWEDIVKAKMHEKYLDLRSDLLQYVR
ncbi:hypothetical protein EHE19_001675 [Ruminiclostridium herbifermentans]|uniref:Uncharacterized protein n=1 Tax=Ruminiclostridium herbifermentans TaxID=2488810 RepID=A0A4U7JBD2_9FIRM|nr:hypothetical protein [Ruminiclostridium herbifermentans]QNU67281.1 hypothetical protein EHE19_001675 [Ruminiclostridium herbifermentans]